MTTRTGIMDLTGSGKDLADLYETRVSGPTGTTHYLSQTYNQDLGSIFYMNANLGGLGLTGANGANCGHKLLNGTDLGSMFCSKGTVVEQSLVYYYKFNSGDINGSNMLANYASGTAVYDATVVSGATIDTTTTKFGGGSLSLNGNNQYVSLPAFTSDFNGLSFSAWIKTITDGWARIFDFSNGQGVDNILLSPQNGLSVFNGTTVGNQPLFNTFNQNTGNWVHIAWTLESTNTVNKTGTSKLYVNGSIYDTRTNFNFYPNAISRSVNYLGKSAWVGDSLFVGNMDEFRMYKRVLNSTEISNLYTKNSLT